MSARNLLKTTSIYFVGNTMSKVITFLLIPIYTKYLEPSSFGTYDITIAYLNIAVLVLFIDIGSATLRFILSSEGSQEKNISISNSNMIFVISTFIYTVFFLIINTVININYFELIFLYGLLSAATQYYGYVTRGLSKNRIFVLSGIVGTFVSGVSNIILIVYFEYGYVSLIISYILASVSQILIMEVNTGVIRKFRISHIDMKYMKSIFIFAIPLSLNYVGVWFLSSYNKIAVANVLGLSESGLYAVTGKFTILLIFLSTSFLYAWQELAFSKKGSADRKGAYFSNAINKYIIALMCISVGMIALIWLIFPHLVDNQYSSALNYIPLSVIAITASAMNGFLGSIFGSIMKTKHIFTSTALGAILNIVLCYFLIPKFGVNGASLSLALGFLLSIIVRIKLLVSYLRIHIKYIYLIYMIIIYTFYVLLIPQLDSIGNFSVLILAMAVFIYFFRQDIFSIIKSKKK